MKVEKLIRDVQEITKKHYTEELRRRKEFSSIKKIGIFVGLGT